MRDHGGWTLLLSSIIFSVRWRRRNTVLERSWHSGQLSRVEFHRSRDESTLQSRTKYACEYLVSSLLEDSHIDSIIQIAIASELEDVSYACFRSLARIFWDVPDDCSHCTSLSSSVFGRRRVRTSHIFRKHHFDTASKLLPSWWVDSTSSMQNR